MRPIRTAQGRCSWEYMGGISGRRAFQDALKAADRAAVERGAAVKSAASAARRTSPITSGEFDVLQAAAHATELAVEENERLVGAMTAAWRVFALVMEEKIKGQGNTVTSHKSGAEIPLVFMENCAALCHLLLWP